MLGRGDPVDVERLRLASGRPRRASGSGTAPRPSCPARLPSWARPARRRAVPVRRSTASPTRAARGRRAPGRRRCPRAGCRPHCAASVGQRRLQVDPRVAACARRAPRRAPGSGSPCCERLVDDEAPDLLERDGAGELLDVDAPVPERRALLVRLGDLRLEGDDALEAQVGGRAHESIVAKQARSSGRFPVSDTERTEAAVTPKAA